MRRILGDAAKSWGGNTATYRQGDHTRSHQLATALWQAYRTEDSVDQLLCAGTVCLVSACHVPPLLSDTNITGAAASEGFFPSINA